MPRTMGIKNRIGDSVKELKEKFEEYRRTVINAEGCKWGGDCDGGRLAFFHAPNETNLFAPSRGPYMMGMTWEKLQNELFKCILLCRKHQRALRHFN